jgi:hypothetical protein
MYDWPSGLLNFPVMFYPSSIAPCVLHAQPSHSPSFDQANNISRTVRSMELSRFPRFTFCRLLQGTRFESFHSPSNSLLADHTWLQQSVYPRSVQPPLLVTSFSIPETSSLEDEGRETGSARYNLQASPGRNINFGLSRLIRSARGIL